MRGREEGVKFYPSKMEREGKRSCSHAERGSTKCSAVALTQDP